MKVNKIHLPAIKLIIVLALITAFVPIVAAQTGTNIASQAALVSEFEVNGLKVLVKRRPNSQTVAAGLFIRGGSSNLTPQNAGIEDFALNAAAEGSVKFPKTALRRELAKTGSTISSGSNQDYSVLALSSTLQSFARSWEIFTDVAMHPAFAQEDVDLTRARLLTALRNVGDDPDGLLQSLVEKTVYACTLYANDPSGSIENITRLTTADLRSYYQKILQTSRLLLVIVGDLDAATLQPRIAASFGKLPRGDYKYTPPAGFDFSKSTLDITSRNLPTNYIEGVFAAPSIRENDFYAMRVATTLLRDRIFEEVRTKRNLSYAPNADMGSLAANTGNIYVTAVDANRAVSVMLNEIENLKANPVELREISGVTGQFLTTYFMGIETNAAQARELGQYELIGGGWRRSFEFLDRTREVKPADVQAVAKKYMKNLRFIVIGNPNQIDRSIFLQN